MILNDSERALKQRLTCPPIPAKADAVRALVNQLTRHHGLGEHAARTIAEAACDPAAVRQSLAEGLTGLTGGMGRNLIVLHTRVWAPWVQRPADEVNRYAHKKRFPFTDENIPPLATDITETPDGLTMTWAEPDHRTWHLNDNRNLYCKDVYTPQLKLLHELGGIVSETVLLPQSETFAEGSPPLHSLRVIDGIQRALQIEQAWDVYRSQHNPDYLPTLLEGKVKPDTFRKAAARDRTALRALVTAIHDKWTPIEPDRYYHLDAVHYLASVLTVPAVIIIGTADQDTGTPRPLGHGAHRTARFCLPHWHTEGQGPRLIPLGRKTYSGLPVAEHSVDEGMITTARQRLMALQVPRRVIDYGYAPDTDPAARLVWWCRAVGIMGGTPETAVAAYAQVQEHDWHPDAPEHLLAFARHVIGGQEFITYVPGDYRKPESRTDSLTYLVRDVDAPFSHLVRDGRADMWAHPRLGNAHAFALAHLALHGALPLTGDNPANVDEQATSDWVQLASVVEEWHRGHAPAPFRINDKLPELKIQWMFPDDHVPPLPGASHAFALRHHVTFTIPQQSLTEAPLAASETEGIDYVAAVVRRWFPDATGVTFTDWDDRIVTGIMIGSVWVKIFGTDPQEARERGVWYPEGRPAGTRDILDFNVPASRLPNGYLLGAHGWPGARQGGLLIIDTPLEECLQEIDSEIIDVADRLLREDPPPVRDRRTTAPVLSLPRLPRDGRR